VMTEGIDQGSGLTIFVEIKSNRAHADAATRAAASAKS
jgi:hypothetical protein